MKSQTSAATRIASIDIMRGLVIILMMLDHVRERFYMHVRTGDPIADSIGPDLFFTRVVTHLCAPVFIFLAGTSAWLYAHPKSGEYRSPSSFLLKRGAVVILIELVFYYLVWADSYPRFLFLQVLWAIGLCLIALSVACRLNYWVIGALGALIVFGHNFVVPLDFAPGELGYIPWAILHDGGELGQVGPLTVSLSYPSLPWFGVILLGYFAGPLYSESMATHARRQWLVGLGASCLALLLVLRGFNLYGETIPWSAQNTALETVMSFINFSKYPPSLDYVLFTLGIGLLVLAWLETVKKSRLVFDLMRTFGSIPMFIYVLHLYVLLAAYWVLYAIFGATQGTRYGFDRVAWIWVGAAVLVAVHYPIAKAFAAYKHREKHAQPWLSYF